MAPTDPDSASGASRETARPGSRFHVLTVGDVHGQWDEADRAFVESGDQAMLVFVGDFGDETVPLVEEVSRLRCPTAIILGNHDGWKSTRGRITEAFRRQLAILGGQHLAWTARPLDGSRFALLGARPFSWGGPYKRFTAFYREALGVSGQEESTDRIVDAAAGHPDASLIAIGHNGPSGLGEGRDAIFGRDFAVPAIDWGDQDFAAALARLRGLGRRIPLVLAGHMHEDLKGGGLRRRCVVRNGSVHVNAAVVPRHRPGPGGRLRHFVRSHLSESGVERVEDIWVDGNGEIRETVRLFPTRD